MQILSSIVNFVLNLGGGIFLPFVITILGLFFKMNLFDSFKNGLKIGAGFTGINLVIGVLCDALSPAVQHYANLGAGFTVTDIGWEGIGAIAWSTPFAIAIVPLGMILNYILIRTKFTKTMDVDVWNYWHFILGAAISYYVCMMLGMSQVVSAIIGILIGLGTFVIVLKLGDKIAPYWQEYYGLPGTTCCNSDAYYMWGIDWVVCKIIDAIPGLNKININAKWVSDKLGSFGETSVLAFFAGVLISVITRLDLATAITMSVTIAACIILVPKMVGLLMEGLVPVSNAARKFFKSHLGDDYDIYIGMDEALYLGDEVGIQCSVIMIPIALALAFLPGVTVFPIASIGSLCYTTCACSLFAKGDVFKTIVASSVCLIYCFEMYSFMAPLATKLALETGYITASMGQVTGSGIEELQCVLLGVVAKLLGAW
ncbi:MAG: hypothetical protein IJF95_06240 [Erysipelotrichaceae bacterium]|jgi:PTS system galactitol-specific IIC component|nr:hypothetical protein [Erysipelotrichaceae bacterium]MBQ5552589.1 hypothetical protein [Erysipelotrichaceae bacterium]MEE3424443.1 PTS transporter subunit IIC [Erysipelotrichaceae bacterium]